MKITDEQVNAMCRVLADNDWLPVDWDTTHDEAICPKCGHVKNSEGDGGESVRGEVRSFLEAALGNKT